MQQEGIVASGMSPVVVFRTERESAVSVRGLRKDLEGCYVTIPTPFADTPGMEVN